MHVGNFKERKIFTTTLANESIHVRTPTAKNLRQEPADISTEKHQEVFSESVTA
jgi:hypothetical protein